MASPKRYLFSGSASGVAAHIRKPINRILPVQAASSLPVTGGLSESKAGPGGLAEYLHFHSAETFAHGDFVDQPGAEVATTTLTASVRDLHVGKLQVGIADAGLIVTRKSGTPPLIQLVDTRLDNVVFDKSHLKITLKDPAKIAALFKKAADTLQTNPKKGVVYSTIVEKIELSDKSHPKWTPTGHFVDIPDFGTAYFGELVITRDSRLLTMVRVQLGSQCGGDVSCSSVQDFDMVPVVEEPVIKAEDEFGFLEDPDPGSTS